MSTQSLFHTISPRVGVGVLNFLTQSESGVPQKGLRTPHLWQRVPFGFSLPFTLLFLPSSYPPFAFPFSSLPSNPARGSGGALWSPQWVYRRRPSRNWIWRLFWLSTLSSRENNVSDVCKKIMPKCGANEMNSRGTCEYPHSQTAVQRWHKPEWAPQ